MEAALKKKTLDPIGGSPTTGKSVTGIINLFVDDLFGTSGNDVKSIPPNTENWLRKLYDKTTTMTRAMRTSMRPTTA